MKWSTLLIFAGLLIIGKYASVEGKIEVQKSADKVTLQCDKKWQNGENKFELDLDKDLESTDTCGQDNIVIRIRTCNNCIELDPTAILAIAMGNILVTGLIGGAVYSLSATPKTRSFSGNKASDKENLIRNGDGDMYQSLSSGQRSEYSALTPGKRK